MARTRRRIRRAGPVVPPPPFANYPLLLALEGTEIAKDIRVLAQGGAHLGEEIPLFVRLFPNLEELHLWEPCGATCHSLGRVAVEAAKGTGLTIYIHNEALGDFVGQATLHLSGGKDPSNFNASSSILELTPHGRASTQVDAHGDERVLVSTLESSMRDGAFKSDRRPDALMLDIHGMELKVLQALEVETIESLELIYIEVSEGPQYYAGCPTLADLREFLEARGFDYVGWSRICAGGMGDALWKRSIRS